MSLWGIHDLIDALSGIPPAEFTRLRVLEAIGRRVLDPDSLRPYLYFCATHYTRNQIFRDALFEVIAIGWEPGQASAIHNHRGQDCWMGVPAGRLQVRNFRLRQHDPRARTCRLEPARHYEMDPTHPAAVDPEEPIHAVHNLPEFGARAVSIHVYSRPFDSCEVYLPERGRYLDMPLHYTSRQGVLCTDERVVAFT